MPVDQSDVYVTMSDGIDVAVRVYRPDGPGPFPTLFAASPYRYDNDDLPQSKVFFWLETGPIPWYVGQGYAYVHLDIRGTGKSGGRYGFMDPRERRDLYEVIEWIAAQDWSNGRVGGIGMSYYCAAQWMMLSQRPPHLTCAAAYDGHYDPYLGWAYPGGVLSTFVSHWWNNSVRVANKFPANGSGPRDVDVDIPALLLAHPERDSFWAERSFEDELAGVTIPVYSIGNWAKRELHLGGNLRAFQLLAGPKKLRLLDLPSGAVALELFETVEFHSEVLLPFYDHYLKGTDTGYLDRPEVEYTLAGNGGTHSAGRWPPEEVSYLPLHLNDDRSGSVTSVNDGGLAPARAHEAVVSYDYPGKDWLFGPVVMTPRGPDTVRETLTFTSAPLADDLDLVGPAELIVYLSSTRTDTRVIARVSEQLAQTEADRAAGQQPAAKVVTKGWLRAAHRALDDDASVPGDPRHLHTKDEPLVPGEPAELRVALIGCGHHLTRGSRIRLELSCGDTQFTDAQFAHAFTPDMVGTDFIHVGADCPSRLLLPVRDRAGLPLPS
jgi:predicted acyl esterase